MHKHWRMQAYERSGQLPLINRGWRTSARSSHKTHQIYTKTPTKLHVDNNARHFDRYCRHVHQL